ncbi:hypothetical protein B296_00050170, partial [Ensete ventricosum]
GKGEGGEGERAVGGGGGKPTSEQASCGTRLQNRGLRGSTGTGSLKKDPHYEPHPMQNVRRAAEDGPLRFGPTEDRESP